MSQTKAARLVPQSTSQPPEEVVHISSFVLVKRGTENVLLTKRLKPEFNKGKWTVPGVVIGYGEHPEAAAKRLVKEQLGSEPRNMKLVEIQSFGDKHWDLCFVYEASIDGVGKVSEDIEHADYFDFAKLPPEFKEDHREIIQAGRK
ncbi:MAG: NUDIX domain-containing protein [Nitrososphaerales archaeon]